MAQIIDHTLPAYKSRWAGAGVNRWNGAYYYSREIVRNIIPNVRTDRSWITINAPENGCDHAIVFVHNNLHPENYAWLKRYDDLILICGVPETVPKVEHIGSAFYLPLSIDVREVQRFISGKDRLAAFVGRQSKRFGAEFPPGTDIIDGMPRDSLLSVMAHYKYVYAVGRTAIEARALGCEILPYDPRFPDPEIWKVVDNREAAEMLQLILDGVD